MTRRQPLAPDPSHLDPILGTASCCPDIRSFPRCRPEAPCPDLRGQIDEPARDAHVDKLGFTVRGRCAWGDRPAYGRRASAWTASSSDTPGTGSVRSGRCRGSNRETRSWSDSRLARLCRDLRGRKVGRPARLSVIVWGDVGSPPVVLDELPVIVATSTRAKAIDGVVPIEECVGHLHRAQRRRRGGGGLPSSEGGPCGVTMPWAGWTSLVNGECVGRARLGLAQPGPRGPAPATRLHHQRVRVLGRPDVRVVGHVHGEAAAGRPVLLQHVPSCFSNETCGYGSPCRRRSVPTGQWCSAPAANGRFHRIVPPRSPDLNLVVFTHQLDYGERSSGSTNCLKKAGAGSNFVCTVISFRDGPLRDAVEQRGIAVHLTDEPPVDDAERYEGRITELAALVAGGGHNVALVNTAHVFSGADVAARTLVADGMGGARELHTAGTDDRIAFGAPVHPGVLDSARSAMEAADALVFEAASTARALCRLGQARSFRRRPVRRRHCRDRELCPARAPARTRQSPGGGPTRVPDDPRHGHDRARARHRRGSHRPSPGSRTNTPSGSSSSSVTPIRSTPMRFSGTSGRWE